MKPYTDTIKVYAASDCNTLQNIAPALTEANFKVFLGVWPNDDAHFNAEKDALTNYLPEISVDNVKAITVGSEALYRGDMSADDLASKINEVRDHIKNIKDKDGKSYESVKVGTVDSWNVLVDGGNKPAIEAADIVLANAFSYWQGQTMDNASYSFFDDIMQALGTIQKIKGDDVEFWVGETGWATEGGNFEASVPSVENAERFWKEGICGIRGWGINTLVFEAFDETWKPPTSGVDGVEQHWGFLDDEGKPKYEYKCDFDN